MVRIIQSCDAVATNRPFPASVNKAGTAKQRGGKSVGVRRWLSLMTIITVAAVLTIAYGLLVRSEQYVTAETGIGYWLGIAGAVLMLALLAYPLRKRVRALAGMGSVTFWFQTHMALGVIGPVLIVIHSNFHLGSLNSTIALIAMLTVAGSGYIGRFLYRAIHVGLSQKKAHVADILKDVDKLAERFAFASGKNHDILVIMQTYETRMLVEYPRMHQAFFIVLLAGFYSPFQRLALSRIARNLVMNHAHQRRWPTRKQSVVLSDMQRLIKQYVRAVKKAALFSAYERLFALWHMLHLPLFVFLVLSVLGHVFAVHMY